MKKELYGICIVVLIALSAVNVDVANKSESTSRGKNVIAKIAKSLSLRNGESPTPTKKIVYSYDASGNMTRRESVTVRSSSAKSDSTRVRMAQKEDAVSEKGISNSTVAGTDSTEVVASGASMTKSAVSGGGNSGVSATEFSNFGNELVNVTIYPNPTHGMLRVEITGVYIPMGAYIEIFSANGSSVGKWTGISYSNTFDISDKPAGIYILRLTLDKDNVNTLKITKN